MTEFAQQQPSTPDPYREYLEQLDAGRVAYQRCDSCAAAVFFPRVLCPACGSTSLSWSTSRGHGVVYATSVVAGPDAGHLVCLVDLEEGFRMMSTVVGVEPERVRIGDRVRATVEPATASEQARVVFYLEAGDDN